MGLDPDRPHLVPHDPRWSGIFTSLRESLVETLGDQIVEVHHVGSTAVPGLRAKPVLDVLVGVESLAASLALVPILADLGFVYGADDELPDRLYFRAELDGRRTHHLSLAELGSRHYLNTLTFRDALRGSERLRVEYESVKQRAVASFTPGTPLHLAKTEFVERVLESVGRRLA